jgi:hypothetical protein
MSANPGIYVITRWRVKLSFWDPDNPDAPVSVTGTPFEARLYRKVGDDAPAFVWRSSGAASNEGTIEYGPNSNDIVLTATAAQRGSAVQESTWYFWQLLSIDTPDLDPVANGRVYIGGEGEPATRWELIPSNFPNITTLGVAALKGDPGKDGDDSTILDTLAILKAADLPLDANARINGYYNAGDGGDGLFKIVAGGTGTADDVFFANLANGRQAKLILADPTRIRGRQLGIKADYPADDPVTAQANRVFDGSRWMIAEGPAGAAVTHVDMGGLDVETTLVADQSIKKENFNGTLKGISKVAEDADLGENESVLVHPKWPVADTDLERRRNKCPITDWLDRNGEVVGTSITQEGAGSHTSFWEIGAEAVGATIDDLGWAGSSREYDPANDPTDTHTIKRLTMTEDDRLRYLAIYGAESAYSDDYEPNGVNKASQMTFDYRVRKAFADAADPELAGRPYSYIIDDHGHNGRGRAPGIMRPLFFFGVDADDNEADPDRYAITGITKGAQTVIHLEDAGDLDEGDAGVLYLSEDSIPFLRFENRMIVDRTGNDITFNIDSSDYLGSFVDGYFVKLDRATIYGGLEFAIAGYNNCFIRYGDPNRDHFIILTNPPSEFTTGSYDRQVYSVGHYTQNIADRFGCYFFDFTYELAITKLIDHKNYLDDNFHPGQLGARQAFGNIVSRWFNGGAQRGIAPLEYLPTGDKNFLDGRFAMFSRFLGKPGTGGGFGTLTRIVGPAADKVLVLAQDWTAGTTGWTLNGDPPVIDNAPWGGGEMAALFTVPPDEASSYITHAITLDEAFAFAFKFMLTTLDLQDETSPDLALATLLRIRCGGAYESFRLSMRKKPSVKPSMIYFKTANTDLLPMVPLPAVSIEASQVYTVFCEQIKGSGSSNGRFRMYIDGVLVGGPYEVLDTGQNAVTEVQIGPAGLQTNVEFPVWIGPVQFYNLPIIDLSNLYTGAGVNGFKFVNGQAIPATGQLTSSSDAALGGASPSDLKFPTEKAVADFVNGKFNSFPYKVRVRAATTGPGTLATSFAAGQTVDGVVLALDDALLIKNQAARAENGLYTVTAGAPTRRTDADNAAELTNATVLVENGTANADTEWTCTNQIPITLGTTAIDFRLIGGMAFVTVTADRTLDLNDSGVCWANTGAAGQVILTAPSSSIKRRIKLKVTDAQNLRLQCGGADRIYDGATLGALTGYIESNTPGSTLTLEGGTSSRWMVVEKTGTWTLS